MNLSEVHAILTDIEEDFPSYNLDSEQTEAIKVAKAAVTVLELMSMGRKRL